MAHNQKLLEMLKSRSIRTLRHEIKRSQGQALGDGLLLKGKLKA